MATHDISALPNVMRGYSGRVRRNVERLVRDAAGVAQRQLVDDTPVDTGRARSNWIASLDAPVSRVIPPYVPYPKGSHTGRGETANRAAAVAEGDAVRKSFTLSHVGVWITNNVPYLELLNNPPGHSTQIPALFFQRVVGRLRAFLVARQTQLLVESAGRSASHDVRP